MVSFEVRRGGRPWWRSVGDGCIDVVGVSCVDVAGVVLARFVEYEATESSGLKISFLFSDGISGYSHVSSVDAKRLYVDHRKFSKGSVGDVYS
jgi:hypothetical protein